MIRDLPYKRGLKWRTPSFLLRGPAQDLEGWRKELEEATDSSVWLLGFMHANAAPGMSPDWQPIMKLYGGWRSLGPGRKFTTEEILEADDLVSIELIRERFTK